MTRQRIPIFNLRWIALILLLISIVSVRSAQANEVRLSDLPVADLIAHLDPFQNPVEPSDHPLTFNFIVVNDSPDEIFWHLRSEVLRPLMFAFFIDGQTDPIFQSEYGARGQVSHASQGPVLKSGLIAMAPGEQLSISATFERWPGPSYFPISVLPKDVSDAQVQQRSLSHGLFFGAMMTFVVLFLLSPNFLMNAASNWFGIYLASMALLSMHSHGYGVDFFDIQPTLYFPVLRLLQTAVMLFYLIFVLSFLKAADAYPSHWRAVWVFIIIGTTVATLEQILGREDFQAIANLVPIAFICFGVGGAVLAVRDRLHGSYYFMAGFLVLMVGGLINYVASLPSFAAWNERIDQLTLIFQTSDALIFGGAILSQMYGLRHSRDEAVAAQLAEAQYRLEISNKLLSTEGDLRRMSNLAEQHRANLASTSHDLRQPITSLRTSLELAKEGSPQLVAELSSGVEFLDKLLDQTLEQTRGTSDATQPQDTREQAEVVELDVILQNVRRMFETEAKQKGLALRVVDSSLSVDVPTIDIIRIVSNLVSNAVRYTSRGVVLVGVRRRNGCAAIEVWDTGRGIQPDSHEVIMEAYERGEVSDNTDGKGLGLAIVNQLAIKNQLTLTVRSTYGKGSAFVLDGLIIS